MRSIDRFILIILLVAGIALTGAAPYAKSAEEGKKAYEEERYAESADHFADALEGGGKPDVMEYNLGNARYKMGDFSQAEMSFRNSLVSEGETSGEYYNLGNSLAQQGEWSVESGDLPMAIDFYQQAIEAYEGALELDYTDIDSIHNLEYARRRIEELQQEQESQQEGEQGESSESEGESEEQDQSQPGDQEGQESAESDESGQSDESSDQGEQSEDQDQGDQGEQQQPGEGESQEGGEDQQQPMDDGLDYSEAYIDYLLDYYEQKERKDGQMGTPFPDMNPDEIERSFLERLFGSPPQSDDDWIDW